MVTPSKLEGIHPQPLGDFVHQRFHGKVALRRAKPAVGACHHAVGENNISLVPDVGTCVEVGQAVAETRAHTEAGIVWSGIQDAARFHGRDRPVASETHTDTGSGRVAPLAKGQLLLARVSHPNGLPRLSRQEGCQGRQPGLILTAEASSKVCTDYADMVMWEAKHFGEAITISVDIAARLPDGQALFIPLG
jgi:hypothetical protein